MSEPDVTPPEGQTTPAEPVAPAEPEPTPLSPPEPQESFPDPDPFAGGPPPLPEPMLVLGGELPPAPAPAAPTEPVDHGTCSSCGGAYDEDGWCTRCGQRRPDPRHHMEERPAPHVAGVCDRGVRHTDNEDAMALWGDAADPTRAALVVCDGVTTATRSAEASLAAAQAALAALTGADDPVLERMAVATDAAAAAVRQVAEDFPDSAPSCTFVAAVVADDVATVGSVGDSRGYWMPDDGEPVQLSTDDSMAQEQVQAGVDRASAEAGPLAHTITRWLGPDAPDHTPELRQQDVSAPGWLLLCSDGLWNYASAPQDLLRVLREEQGRVGDDPLELASALVAWATARGGADNITVALARTGAARQDGDHG